MVQIPVFSYCLIPNSISFSIAYSIAYSYCLIPITCVFTVKVGLLIPHVQKRKKKDYLFILLQTPDRRLTVKTQVIGIRQ